MKGNIMACEICRGETSIYCVKKVHLCEDCYQKLLGLRYKESEAFEWVQALTVNENTSEAVKNMLKETIKEYGADAPAVPTAEIDNVNKKMKKETKVSRFFKKTGGWIKENF